MRIDSSILFEDFGSILKAGKKITKLSKEIGRGYGEEYSKQGYNAIITQLNEERKRCMVQCIGSNNYKGCNTECQRKVYQDAIKKIQEYRSKLRSRIPTGSKFSTEKELLDTTERDIKRLSMED